MTIFGEPFYKGFSAVDSLDLNGDAQQVDNAIQLTTGAFEAGSAFYNDAILLANDGSFRCVFTF